MSQSDDSAKVSGEPHAFLSGAQGKTQRGQRRSIRIGIIASLVAICGIGFSVHLSTQRTVPDLEGQTPGSALQVVEGLDLILHEEKREQISALRDENQRIAGQQPAAGEVLRKGEAVTVTVGARAVELPDVRGMTTREAEEALDRGQLVLNTRFEGKDLTNLPWKITSQTMPGGSKVPAGQMFAVQYDIPVIRVPEVSGLKLSEAEEQLRSLAILPLWKGEGDFVISASFKPGTTVKPFTEVTLAAGFKMPDVVGMTLYEAQQELSGFENVTSTTTSSRPISAQNVAPGAVVSADAEIVLTIPGPSTVYRITGNGSSAAITWAAPGSFSIQQATAASLPWEMSFPTDSGTAVFNAIASDGDVITCQLVRNGKVVKELTSTGAFAVVQC